MKAIIHKANTRGFADHGWLKAYHSFSFANFHNAERMNFGVLRVLNDDTIAPGMGFGTHPHDNMEIITIPLEGELWHKDSMGNASVIKNGEIQVMSAGSGITHSEYNNSRDKSLKLLQIWLLPNKRNVEPRYDQSALSDDKYLNQLYQIISPNKDDEGFWIHQNAWFHIGRFTKNTNINYPLKSNSNGLYVFIIEGQISIGEETFYKRDGLGLWEVDSIDLNIHKFSHILLMEVPMR